MRQIECTPQGEIPFGTLSLQGDQALAVFEELAMPLSHSLYNFARWLAHNQHDAEDLVQETYLRALRSFASFEPGSNFRAWMFKILKNTFLTACSKQERRTTIPIDIEENSWALPSTSDTPESLLIEHFDIDAVRTAIEQLSATHREVILLCDVEEASYRDIAEILSIPIGTVMSRLARARKALCELLGRAPCASLASGLAHPIEMHEKDARVPEPGKRTAGYERRVHRSELPRRRASA
jgi:RNA polymerase sigma factor (sigma-70 family)